MPRVRIRPDTSVVPSTTPMEPVMVDARAKIRTAGMAIMYPAEAAVPCITATTGFFSATVPMAW